jgi:hypothetical protein
LQGWVGFALWALSTGLASPTAAMTSSYQNSLLLPPASGGGPGLMEGDLIAVGDGAAAVYTRPDGSFGRLDFRRFGPDLAVLVERQVGDPAKTYYEPSLCFDGSTYAVAVSTLTQAQFMRLSEAGSEVLPPVALPGIPIGAGWRTAAFRVLCTAEGYAVFGLALEPTFPGSTTYYTHLFYWLVDQDGMALVTRDLLDDEGLLLAPIAYPGFEGAEKEYYAVIRAGTRYFLAYSAECGSPAVFQTCYRTLDVAGHTLRAEGPATTISTKGPHLASNGQVVGLATLRQNPFPGGNSLYVRFFGGDGTPRGPEVEYDDPADFPLGFAPQIAAYGGRFLAAWAYSDPFSGETLLKLAEFDAAGSTLLDRLTVADPLDIFRGDINLGVDLQLAGDGRRLFGKGQTYPDFIRIRPIVFLMRVDSDEDGAADTQDNCPLYPTADTADTDGDGRGDECECTDQNGDGRNTVSDLVAINSAIFNPGLATPLCDGNNDGLCNVKDIVAANVEIFSPTSTSTCSRQPFAGP